VAAGLPIGSIAVNVSALEFRNEDFLESLFATLKETGLDPKSLELEVTESALMKNAEISSTILQILRKIGVRVAVDDFGTGYSSLSYLRKFPLDALKIDQSFVRQIADSPDGNTIVSTIITMARSLHLRVIAEGVETPEELEFLLAQQCDEAQGYKFSRPIPAEQFEMLLRDEQVHQSSKSNGSMKESNNGKRRPEPEVVAFTLENIRLPDHDTLRLIAREGSPEC
jgi:EAL domain-containing protein (putative c-di-GMP-specific phosphodiesterase class I)